MAQIQRNQVADTYEAVFTGVEASDVAALKDLPEFARVGEFPEVIRLSQRTIEDSCFWDIPTQRIRANSFRRVITLVRIVLTRFIMAN